MSQEVTNNSPKSTLVPISIIAGVFFIFGFVTWINGALIPFMKTINELTEAQSYLVASASYISFVVMALPASYILEKIGYKKGMSLGFDCHGRRCLGFYSSRRSQNLLGISNRDFYPRNGNDFVHKRLPTRILPY